MIAAVLVSPAESAVALMLAALAGCALVRDHRRNGGAR